MWYSLIIEKRGIQASMGVAISCPKTMIKGVPQNFKLPLRYKLCAGRNRPQPAYSRITWWQIITQKYTLTICKKRVPQIIKYRNQLMHIIYIAVSMHYIWKDSDIPRISNNNQINWFYKFASKKVRALIGIQNSLNTALLRLFKLGSGTSSKLWQSASNWRGLIRSTRYRRCRGSQRIIFVLVFILILRDNG